MSKKKPTVTRIKRKGKMTATDWAKMTFIAVVGGIFYMIGFGILDFYLPDTFFIGKIPFSVQALGWYIMPLALAIMLYFFGIKQKNDISD